MKQGTPSEEGKQFLLVKTADGLARLLSNNGYFRFKRLIYPAPHYSSFSLQKKKGGARTIDAPQKRLLDVQRRLAHLVNEVTSPKPSTHGFVKNRSIITNAAPHAGATKRFVFNIDLENFFPSITAQRVHGVFRAGPFNFPPNIATILTQICCYQGRLPQGAATSPAISNLVCRRLDSELQLLAKECRATYTRYCDDITFSFTAKAAKDLPDRIVKVEGAAHSVGASLEKIIQANGFRINAGKVRLHSKHGRMQVTGLTVNEFINVRRTFVDEIRGMLHACEVYGISGAQSSFAEKYRRELRTKALPNILQVLRGKVLFLKMVRGANDRLFVRFARRVNTLIVNASAELAAIKVKVKPINVHQLVANESELDRAVYFIQCENDGDQPHAGSEGTAFFLKDVGVITCDHVIRIPGSVDKYFTPGGNGEITLRDRSRNLICYLEITTTDKHADIAILKPVGDIPSTILWLPAAPVPAKVHDRVKLIGYPNHQTGKTLTAQDAEVLNHYKTFTFSHFEIDKEIKIGNSGGPITNAKGEVVGIAKERTVNGQGNNAALALQVLIDIARKK